MVVAQLGVTVRVVVVQSGEANDSEAAKCLVRLMEVVATVAVVATTDDELVVVPAVLADRTAQQDRDGFVLKCL